jgi:hypothetical protein
MANESVLQKLIYVIRKEKQAVGLELWEKQKFIGYFSALDFIEQRIIEMQKDLHNERIESITVDMKHEILHAYDNGFHNARNEIMNKLHSIEDNIPYSDDAAIEYYNERFVFKK